MSDSEDGQGGIPLIEDISSDERHEPLKKRKRDAEVDLEEKRAARKKKRTKKKPQDVDDGLLDSDLGVNHAIGHMDSRLVADHVAQRVRRFQPDLSLVEAEDLYLPEKAVRDTTSYDQPRTTDNMAGFLEQFSGPRRKSNKAGKKLSDAHADKGTPHTLVVAGAGIRAADVTRALRKFQTKDAAVAKLFAKHIKLKEAVETVKKTRIGIGVGTPQRLIDLLDDGALLSASLERIVIDASHIDQKKRGILDMKELALPLVQLLTRADLKERYGPDAGARQVELLFF